MDAARTRILAAVRAALGRDGPLAERESRPLELRLQAHAKGPCPPIGEAPETRFRARALALASTLDAVPSLADVPSAVARYLAPLALPRRAVVWQQLASLDWVGSGMAVEARNADDGDLVGITGCFCAIAETGTLALLSGADTPASVSLLPETHIAVVDRERIVSTMEDAWALVRSERTVLPRTVNFVSGPSRTADIEQTLVLGAHGPYRLHVILVGGPASR